MSHLLTIVIPTYNRADFLRCLLESLASEVVENQPLVEIVIGDNCSSDSTSEVGANFVRRFPFVRMISHPENLGGEGNFCACLDSVQSKYVWILGDDDFPKPGTVTHLLSVLGELNPDLLYLPSEWMPDVSVVKGELVDDLAVRSCSRVEFASEVNVWMTFISGMVFNFETLKSKVVGLDIRRYFGSSLVQLGWVFPLLDVGERFYISDRFPLLATIANSGGYPAVKVFGENFTNIVGDVNWRDPEVSRVILHRHMVGFLPDFIWGLRFGSVSQNFTAEKGWDSLRSVMGGKLFFWFFLSPILRFPKPLAYPFLRASRWFGR